MPCRWSRRCRAAKSDVPTTLPSPGSAPDVDSWRRVRFGYIRALRKQTKCIILLMAMIEALKYGPLELVYRGREGYPAPDAATDYGFAYNVAYLLSYVYVCLFMLLYVPLFSWWIPSSKSGDTEKPSTVENVAQCLKKINMVLLPMSIGACGISYLINLVAAFVYVDARPTGSRRLPKNSKKNWLARAHLLAGVVAVYLIFSGALAILGDAQLARFVLWNHTFNLCPMELLRVKTLEYYIILCPIQINLGLLLGSKMQMRTERRAALKEARELVAAKTEPAVLVDEKTPLVET